MSPTVARTSRIPLAMGRVSRPLLAAGAALRAVDTAPARSLAAPDGHASAERVRLSRVSVVSRRGLSAWSQKAVEILVGNRPVVSVDGAVADLIDGSNCRENLGRQWFAEHVLEYFAKAFSR